MTSNPDEGMRWLARSLGWERSMVRLRHAALADAATADVSELTSAADEPFVALRPGAGRTDPAGVRTMA